MRRIIVLLVTVLLVFSSNSIILHADDSFESNTNDFNDSIAELNNLYAGMYQKCLETKYDHIVDDESAYAFLLQHIEKVSVLNGLLQLDAKLEMNKEDNDGLIAFIEKVNNLVELDAIIIDQNTLQLSYKTVETTNSDLRQYIMNAYNENGLRYQVFDLMPEARQHAYEMQRVYNNTLFGAGYGACAAYFIDRVKTGGPWDYKRFLGISNYYYIPEVNENMSGETIGNFHYGYVGSTVFRPWVLKSAAGMYQIYSGTSQWNWLSSYFDDPADQADIQWGINWYNAHHY